MDHSSECAVAAQDTMANQRGKTKAEPIMVGQKRTGVKCIWILVESTAPSGQRSLKMEARVFGRHRKSDASKRQRRFQRRRLHQR